MLTNKPSVSTWEILDHLTTAVIILDRQLHVQYLNSAAEILLETSESHRHGQTINELFTEITTEQSSSQLLQTLLTAMEQGHSFTKRETQLLLPHGDSLTVDLAITPMPENELLIELTPRDHLLKINRDEVNRFKQETTRILVRGLAHEIKNPLGGIRGAAQLMEREFKLSGLTEYTEVIIDETDRLSHLVDRMLGPMTPPKMAPINIHEVLERVCQLLFAETQGQINISRDYDPSIPELVADREQLLQVFLNIGRNAMQALSGQPAPNGKIIFKTRTKRQFTIDKTCYRLVCKIEIIDNGPGISDSLKDRIFYPMISGRAEGSGLGLSIAQAIVSQHQGQIECDSEPGQTRFILYIPLSPGESKERL